MLANDVVRERHQLGDRAAQPLRSFHGRLTLGSIVDQQLSSMSRRSMNGAQHSPRTPAAASSKGQRLRRVHLCPIQYWLSLVTVAIDFVCV